MAELLVELDADTDKQGWMGRAGQSLPESCAGTRARREEGNDGCLSATLPSARGTRMQAPLFGQGAHGCFRIRTLVGGAEQFICTLSPEPHLSLTGLGSDCHVVKEGRTQAGGEN